LPVPAPADWRFALALPSPERIELDVTLPETPPTDLDSVYFHSFDLQVNSDEPQQAEPVPSRPGTFRLALSRPRFAPETPAALSGVLHRATAWPGTASQWVEISIPWPEGVFPESE